jgi:hypothetical protein
MRRDLEGAAGRAQTPMPEQALDAPQIDPRFESVGGERMPQQVRVDYLREVRRLPGVSADALHGACRHRARPRMTGKEPGARFLLLPILP